MSIHISRSKKRIVAADEDFDFGDTPEQSSERVSDDTMFDDNYNSGGFEDQLDDIADNLEDMQDQLDEVQEDDVNIEVDNNIENHYIVECDRCHGIFISALVESDQPVTSISGVCPLCDKESEQYIKWIVKPVKS